MATRQEEAKSFFQQVLPAAAAELAAAGAAVEAVAEAAPNPYEGEGETARAYDKAIRGEPLSDTEQFTLEAIIIPDQRPAIAIANGTFVVTHPSWLHLANPAPKAVIEAAIPSVGRVELPTHPSLPYGGTGFIVGEGLMMTNRHVAEIFALGLGQGPLTFRPGQTAAVDLEREVTSTQAHLLEVRQVLMIHPFWDMALLKVTGLPSVQKPLKLSLTRPEDLAAKPDVAVIGYPAFDPRNDAAVQQQVFGGLFNVKRLQPGKLGPRASIGSFGHTVSAVTHDGSTLGGASGSAVVHIDTGEVAALHFAGIYLKANYGVPAWELARDARVVDAGVRFAGTPQPDAAATNWWTGFEAPGEPSTPAGGSTSAGPSVRLDTAGQSLTFVAPIEITVRLGATGAQASAGAAPTAASTAALAVEGLVEPFHTADLSERAGYDPMFLGPVLPLPEPKDRALAAPVDGGGLVLKYAHHSVVMHKRRRLALFTASNIDTSNDLRRPEPGRDYSRRGLTGLGPDDREKWFIDPRIEAGHQLPDRFFSSDGGAFDKGHIVRREDVAWGASYDAIRVANGDTYHVTNCSPQVAGFNQSTQGRENWGDLENFVLAQAQTERLSVFAGPVLSADDPVFIGVDSSGPVRIQIPKAYWKVVVAAQNGQLQSFGFVLDQDLTGVPLEFIVDSVWRTHMIPIAALEARLQVRFPDAIRAVDQATTPSGAAVQAASGAPLVET